MSRIALTIYGDPAHWRYISDANNLISRNIQIGQILIIPNTNSISSSSIDVLPEAAPTSRQSQTHGPLSISADTVTVKTDGSLYAEGYVIIESYEDTLTADSVTIEPETEEGILAILTGNVTRD